MLEHCSNLFQGQSSDFRVEEENPNPAQATRPGIEAKCAGWGHGLHHGQERTRHDHVGDPVRTSHPHSTHGPDLEREEIGAHPGRVTHGHTIENDKPQDENQHDDARRGHVRVFGNLHGL